MPQLERAVFDLRRGRPVHLTHDGHSLLALAIESMAPDAGEHLAGLAGSAPRVVVGARRAEALGLAHDGDGAVITLAADAPAGATADLATAVPPRDGRPPGFGGSAAPGPAERASLALARAGRLLPATVVARVAGEPPPALAAELAAGRILSVDAASAAALRPGRDARRVSEATVPLAAAATARFVLYREAHALVEHVALVIGEPVAWHEPVPVRLHSACLTGDLFGSLRCDCGDQLRAGLAAIAEAGGGVLLYLAQEGRGIGLANKLRAYGLQDAGHDTVEADRVLGFDADERSYDVAVAMLDDLGLRRVCLLTNNPAKIEALEGGGIDVAERRPLHGRLTPHNRRYLDTKARRAGHWLAEMLVSRGEPGSGRD